jgi:type VI secretion system protein ImpH
LGLTGPSGVLPAHYTDLLGRLNRDFRTPEKQALSAWLDLFNHRLTSLFYRAWEKYRPFVPYQRGEYRDRSPDTFTKALLSFAGIGGQRPGAPADALFPSAAYQLPRALVRYAGLLAQRPHNVANLLAILKDYFALPIEILQFQGQWMALAEDQQTRLGHCGTLGINSVVGPRIFDRKGKVRIRIGPLNRAQFEQLLPGAPRKDHDDPHLAEIACVVRSYLGPELDFDVQLVLRGDEIPVCQLGEEGGAASLGWNTWLPAANASIARQDATFTPEDAA